MISSLQTRLLLAVGVLAVAAVAAVAFTARFSTHREFERFQDMQRIRDTGDLAKVLDAVSASLNGVCCNSDAISRARAVLPADDAAFVFDMAGVLTQIVSASDLTGTNASYKDNSLDIDLRQSARGLVSGMRVTIKGGPVKRIAMADGSSATVHIVPMRRPDVDQPAAQFLGSIDRRLLVVTAGVAVFALLITWLISRRIVGPIAELRDAARALAAGQLSRRVKAHGSDEVAELANGFNQMAEALERQEQLRRNLVHDVAHELRTPLTSLRCRVESVLDGLVKDPMPVLTQVNEDVSHLSQLVSDLEELAHAEARELPFAIADTNVGSVCRSALRVAGLEADPRVRLNLEEGLTARADAVRLRQIILNLLTNADRYTPISGVITLRSRSDSGLAIVEVHNTGSALTAGELSHVFDRFYRTDPARQRATGGSGLGLAIVKQLAEAQSGTVSASSDSAGVTFAVKLPAAS